VLSWQILEAGDGCVVQIVYAGGPAVEVRGEGILEGQSQIRELRYGGTIRSPQEQLRAHRADKYFLFLNLAAIAIFVTRTAYRVTKGHASFRDEIPQLLIVALMVVTTVMLATRGSPEPPFGFE
jgi:hypothetical protein